MNTRPPALRHENNPSHSMSSDKRVSPVWKYIEMLTNGPVLNDKKVQCSHICVECRRKGLPLKRCLVSLGPKNNPSNGKQHLDAHHKGLLPKSKVTKSTPLIPSRGLNQTGIHKYNKANNDVILQSVHEQLVRLSINRQCALSFGSDYDMTMLLQLASKLIPNTYKPLTRSKQNTVLVNLFSRYVSLVRTITSVTRALYLPTDDTVELSGWITVHHDGWDARTK